MAKILISKRMEQQAMLKSARLVHKHWEMMRCSLAILASFTCKRDIEEVLSLKWAEIYSKAGVIEKWGEISTDAFALILGAFSWKIDGSEYVFPDRFGEKIEIERFEEICEKIDEEAAKASFLIPNTNVTQ